MKGCPLLAKVNETIAATFSEGKLPLFDHHSPQDFVLSVSRRRSIFILMKASTPIGQTIDMLSLYLEPGDAIINGGNEWYKNIECRIREASPRGLLYLGMGIFGSEDDERETALHGR
ncbi:hypothetical protein ZIOFF_009483 [Zingiber officinale]|uniref:6-phosphogluconate dehydrogenase NADP-binding domain-containing protein n=1 Tax=Zingiber officinale TaxID=94328 RepID=A0A8J5HL16_ZINOF|nr:hypothetical protein ZIOFF_009483 [Zingiber officinale]